MFVSTGLIRDGSSAIQTITADLSGGLYLTKTGTGSLYLSGNNTFTGMTTVQDGILGLNSTGAMGNGGLTMLGGTLGNYSGSPITCTFGGVFVMNSDFSFGGNADLTLVPSSIVLDTTHTITMGNTNRFTLGSVVSSVGVGLNVNGGTGTLVLSNTNLFGGNVAVSGNATIEVTAAQGLGTVGNINIGSGSTVFLNNTAATNWILGTVTGSGTLKIANPVTAGTTTATIPGTVNFSGFSGSLLIPAGTAGRGKVSCSTTTGFPATMSILVGTNCTLYLNGATTHNAPITLNGGDTGESLGQLRIEASCVYAGTITINGSTVSPDNIIGTNTTAATISGNIVETGGARELSKGGSGTLTISNPPSITGGFRINAGTLIAPIGTTAGTSTYFGSNTITLNGGTLDIQAGSTSNVITIPNNFVVSATSTLKNTDAKQVYSGTITANAGVTITQGFANKGLTISGNISGTGRITRTTAATTTDGLTLSGTNSSWSGGLTLSTSGDMLDIKNNTVFGTGQFIISNNVIISNSTGGILNCSVSGGYNLAGGNGAFIKFDGPNEIQFSGGNFVLSGTGTKLLLVKDSCVARINSIISGAFALSKGSGTGYGGTLVLAGVNTFTGVFTVSQGTVTAAAGVAFNAGNGPALGTNASVVVSAGCTLNSTANFSLWGGNANTRTITNNGTVTMGAGLAEYIYGLSMTGGTLSTADSAGMWRTCTTCTITTVASATSSTISGLLDMTNGSLSITVADGAVEADLIINSKITENTGAGTGAKNITKAGAGALYITNTANVYTGTTNVNAGTLAGIGRTGTGTTTISSGATIQGGNGTGNTGTLTIGGMLIMSTGSLIRVTHSTTAVGVVAVVGALTLNNNAVTFDATALNAGTYTLFTANIVTGTLATPTLTGTGRTFSNYTYNATSVTITLT